MKFTLATAALLGLTSAIQLQQRFIDFDFPDAGNAETGAANAAAAQKGATQEVLDLTSSNFGSAKTSADEAIAAHDAAKEARQAAATAAEAKTGSEEEKVAADAAAKAAITAEENARKMENAAVNWAGTKQHELNRAQWDDSNAGAAKAAADTALATEKARIQWSHEQWQYDMDTDRATKRNLDAGDNLAWLEYVKDRDNAILQGKQAKLSLDKFHQAMQQKMDAQYAERTAYIKAQHEAAAEKSFAEGKKEDAFWDAKHDAIDAGLQAEYGAEQTSRMQAASVRKAAAYSSSNAEDWAANMPEHVSTTHDSSSNLVQDKFLGAGKAGGAGDADSKLAGNVKGDAAIEAVKGA